MRPAVAARIAPRVRTENKAVQIAESPIVVVDEATIDCVIAQARGADRGRARLLLHRSPDELLHEMLIALPRESCDRPHINFRSGKSFHVVRGRMVLMVFVEDGSSVIPYRVEAGSNVLPSLVRLNDPYYHTIIPLTDYVVFVETNMGPFTGNKFAPWSPEDMGGPDGQDFSQALRELAAAT